LYDSETGLGGRGKEFDEVSGDGGAMSGAHVGGGIPKKMVGFLVCGVAIIGLQRGS